MSLIKKIYLALGLIVSVALILLVLNWNKIQRLQKTLTLFDADVIVHNFSHMDDAFLHQPLLASAEPYKWPESHESLPRNIQIMGEMRNLEGFLKETSTTSFLVIRDGQIIFEDYYLGTERDDLRISWSVAKSFMSALMGVAVESGQIKSLDDTVESYVPSLRGGAYEGATIRNVLNMASGADFNEDYLDPKSDINKMGRVIALGGSMDEYSANLEGRVFDSGTARLYVSIDTHVAAMVLRAATGKSLHDLFNENFGAKLGFGKAPHYLTDGQGVAFALGGLNMRSRDYALFGQLMLQGGQMNGQQILPKFWVDESTAVSAPSNDIGGTAMEYGYQWWVQKPVGPDYHAGGIYGQFIYINPETNIVIVKTSAHREFQEPAKSGASYKQETVNMMRNLSAYYTAEKAP